MAMKPAGGRDIDMVANPLTGRFDFVFDETNNPAFTDSDLHLVLSLLLEYRGKYWNDATGKRGSRLTLIKNDRSGTKADLEAAVREALAPAIADGRLRGLDTVTAVRNGPGRYDMLIFYRNAAGQQKNARVPWQ